jgi:hypothetical protein
MSTRPSSRTLAIAVAALLAVAAAGYWGYSAHQKRQEARKAMLALVADSAAVLRDALGIETAPPTVDRSRFVKRLADHAAKTESNYRRFQRLGSRPGRALADAADAYLLGARETLKRQLEAHRQRVLMAEDARALREHMGSGNRGAEWGGEAVRAREKLNHSHRAYRIAAEALDSLLESLPENQARVAPHLAPTSIIPDALVADARRRVQQDLRRVEDEVNRLQRFEAFR